MRCRHKKNEDCGLLSFERPDFCDELCEEFVPADLPEAEASAERISSVVRCCPNTDDILKETVENALYSTGRYTTDQCTDLAEGIIIYIKDSGLKISRQ